MCHPRGGVHHRGAFTNRGGGLFPVNNFDVDNGWGGGVDVVHNQGVLGEGGSWFRNDSLYMSNV